MRYLTLIIPAAIVLCHPSHAQDLSRGVTPGSGLFTMIKPGEITPLLPAEIPLLLYCPRGAGQSDPGPFLLSDPEEPDSIKSPVKRKLLPDNMSFMEKGLWGERGLLRSIGIASELTPEVRKSELGIRRTMLTMHQIGGFVTLASMITAAYFGQKVIDGESGYRRNHQYAVAATIAAYSATGLLAVLSPPPLIRRDEISTTTVHKTLAWVHFLGMVTTPILGGMISRRGDYYHQAHIHQISAYITTAALAASMIIVTF